MLRISHFTITEQSQQAPNTPPLAPIQQLWPSDEKAVLLLSYSTKNLMYSQMLRWTSGRTAPCQYHGYNDCVLCPTWLFVGKSHRAVSKNEQYSISSWLIICTLQGRLTRNCWSWVGKFCHTHHIAWTLPYLTIIYLLPPANFHCGGNWQQKGAGTVVDNSSPQSPPSFFLNGTCVYASLCKSIL